MVARSTQHALGLGADATIVMQMVVALEEADSADRTGSKDAVGGKVKLALQAGNPRPAVAVTQ
jgi:hypothetical protein